MQTQSYATDYNTYYNVASHHQQRITSSAFSSHPTYVFIHQPIQKPPSSILKPIYPRNWQYPAHTLSHILCHIESSQSIIYQYPSIIQNAFHVPPPPNLKYLTQQPTEFPYNILHPALVIKKNNRHHAQQPPPISSTPRQRKDFWRTICTSKKTETTNSTPQQTQGSLVCERSEKEHKDCDETQWAQWKRKR